MVRKVIAENIKFYRNSQDLSQYRLAELADINEKTVTRAESGKVEITLDILVKISKALNVPVYSLFVPRTISDNKSADLRNIINIKLETLNINKLNAVDKMISIINQIE